MSEIFHTRAAEIIAAYGADPARWPDAERATAEHVIAASAELTAALAAARALDDDLAAWASAPVGGVASHAAVNAATVAARRPRPLVRWALGTGLAASLAAALVLLVPGHTPMPAAVATVATADDGAAFARVFTPTPDEEQVL